RIVAVDGAPFVLKAGASCVAQYDIPADAWYFAANRQPEMPFGVLLEVALQPCGWLAAYVGSALASAVDVSFRNLGGEAVQLEAVGPRSGTLTSTAALTQVSNSGGMIIQHYKLKTECAGRTVYEGTTYFGFFTKQALANQVGLRDAKPYKPTPSEAARAEAFPMPEDGLLAAKPLRMIDAVETYVADGGPTRLGFIQGVKRVDPTEWFFKAHFHQDPVCPGSLGLESLLQLLKVAAVKRWGRPPDASPNFGRLRGVDLAKKHRWSYRGQVLPTDVRVEVSAVVTRVDEADRRLWADGWLIVDGRIIYQMNDFTLRWSSDGFGSTDGARRERP
ncbi:MAG: type I polyketide synthase, partial [Planctomycetia bacterium]